MRNRSIMKIILLSLITFGFYGLYWSISTKNEMNRLGAQVPTAWLIIVPFISIYWFWKHSEAVEKITGGKVSAPLAFIVELFLGFIGDIIIQIEFNKMAAASAGSEADLAAPVSATPLPLAAAAPALVVDQSTSFAPVSPQTPANIPVVSSDVVQPQPPAQTPPQV